MPIMSRLVRNEPISSWSEGDVVQGFALLTRKELRQDRNGNSYLDLELTDATGRMTGRAWSGSAALDGDYEASSFVAFRGQVKRYRDQLQISVDDCRAVTDEDRRLGFDESQLIPSTHEDIADLWKRLESALLDHVERPVLRRLASEALEIYGPALREHPAAKTMHHAYRGGLLEHTVSMAELAVLLASHYRDLDRDLLLVGVLFHDLGKLQELGAMPANDYTLVGRLVGHVVLGRDMLRERAAAIPDFPEDLLLILEHLVLSHQGRREYASPVEPMIPEALVLHAIDDLDSKLNHFLRAEADEGEVVYHRGLGRYVYHRESPEPAEDGNGGGETAGEAPRPESSASSRAEVPAAGSSMRTASGHRESIETPPRPSDPVLFDLD